MYRSTLRLILLAVLASMALVALPALADWNVATDFSITNPTNPAGGWTYGYVPVSTNPAGYTITVPGANVATFHDGYSGFRYFLDGSSTNLNGDRGPMIGECTTNFGWWIFRKPLTDELGNIISDIYMMPATGTNQMPIIRWTAAVAGTYSFTGSLTSVNNGHNADYWFIKNIGGTSTILANGSGAWNVANALNAPLLSMAAGDSVDVIVNGGLFQRAYAR